MKIVIVGPGIMPIPPKGWGAVESLIYDYYVVLKEMGHDVKIVNEQNHSTMVREINNFDADIVHIQYDNHITIAGKIKKPVIITSHYAYLEQPDKHGGYSRIFREFLSKRNVTIFALSEGIRQTYIKRGRAADNIHVVPNGVRYDLFEFTETPEDKSIYLAKIDARKSQYKYHNIPNLYFAGNIADKRYNKNNYLGEWSKDTLYKELTNYSNLVLLSDGEAHPLVCMEAMSAGLGLVLSEWATANLDTRLPFIDVIPKKRMNDIPYISDMIEYNRVKSAGSRKEIREYVKTNFTWERIIEDYYLPTVNKIL